MNKAIMFFLFLLMLAAAGCSSSSDSPVTPNTSEDIMTIPKGIAN